jgi:hypothetical protein
LWELPTLPPGLTSGEVTDILISERARQGNIRVYHNVDGEGREGLYHALLVSTTTFTGGGLIGYRILAVFAGMISVAMVYALGRRLYGAPAALTATALFGVNMFAILLSRGIGRETLLPLYVTGTFLTLARALPIYGERPVRGANTTTFAILGVSLGAGFYIHPASLVVTLVVMIFIAYMVFTRQPLSRRALSYTWFAVVVMIVLATPYLISSLGSPELSGARRLFFEGASSNLTSPIEAIISGINGIIFRGDSDPAHNLPDRPLIDLVSGLLLLVGVITTFRYRRQPRFALLFIAIIFMLPVALLAAGSPNFFAFAALLPILMLLIGVGITTLYRSLPPRTRIFAILGVGLLLVYNIVWTVNDTFNVWHADEDVQTVYQGRLGALAHRLDTTSDTLDAVMCSSTPRIDQATGRINRAQTILLMMHRQTAPIRYADCRTGLVFTDGGTETQIIFPDPNTLAEIHPFLRRWYDQGQPITDGLPMDAVILMDNETELADTIGTFTTTAPVSYAPEAPGGQDVTAPPVRMGGNLTFLGYEDTLTATYYPGDTVALLTYWRVDGELPNDLRLFVHFLSDPSAIAVQWDEISVSPAQLRPRDVFIQATFVQLPFEMLAGTYGVSIGAYEDTTDTRLPVFDGDQSRGERLFLGPLNVGDASADNESGG